MAGTERCKKGVGQVSIGMGEGGRAGVGEGDEAEGGRPGGEWWPREQEPHLVAGIWWRVRVEGER
jgi:hypothetical protein